MDGRGGRMSQIIKELKVEILSETTFAHHTMNGTYVDTDVLHDEDGIPFISGKTIRGLLIEEASYLTRFMDTKSFENVASFLFGRLGIEEGQLLIEDGLMDEVFRQKVKKTISCKHKKVVPGHILGALTEVRYQTSIDQNTGTAEEHSLRSVRVLHPGISFFSKVKWLTNPDLIHFAFLACCCTTVRNAGLSRNRGRGRIRIRCLNEKKEDITESLAVHWLEEWGI